VRRVFEDRQTILGIIPARGNSESVPKKNIARVAGEPLLAFTIRAALEAPSVTRVIVTTESQEIATIARQLGAEVPFLRPLELAQADTPGIEPILHSLRWIEEHDEFCPDYAMVLQPTSPLRTGADIEAAVQLARDKGAHSVVSVCPVTHHPYWTKRVDDDGRLVEFFSVDPTLARRQDLPLVHALNGAIYLARRELLLKRQTFYTDRTYAYVMPPERSLDIDSPWDLYLADLILRDKGKDGRD
jgi:N-acylneuraminate cytidylyltransferase/CMP-N,N'-diacetyllegionaminic acid synthase